MKKYWMVARNTWDEMLTYRLNFAMFRLRNILSFLTVYYLWIALIPEDVRLFGYNQTTMLTYIVGTALLAAFVMASRSYTIGDDINQGNLSNYLTKPVNYFFYWAAKDMGDKAMNILFASVEVVLLYFLLRPPLFIQTDSLYLAFFGIAVFIGMMLYFLFNVLLGMIAFWSSEVWAPRFIFMILVSFFAGNYFPLDILPEPIYRIFSFLPFQYLIYFPMNIYLHKITVSEIVMGISTAVIWCSILFVFIQICWQRGLRMYTAEGK